MTDDDAGWNQPGDARGSDSPPRPATTALSGDDTSGERHAGASGGAAAATTQERRESDPTPAEPGAVEVAAASGPTTTENTPPRRRRHRGSRTSKTSFLRELPILIVIALGLALLIKAFVVQAFYIPSGSMEKTLLINDRVLVNKLVYDFRSVHRGEIVVFNGKGTGFPAEVHVAPPSNFVQEGLRGLARAIGVGPPSESDFIKRVIGVGGDHVICCDSAGRVTVNGVALAEPYLYPGNVPSTQPFNVVVPKGELFVMGDHRGDSADSRAHGPIPADRVIGRAFIRVWPLSRIGLLHVPATFDRKALSTAAGGGVLGLGLATVPVLVRRRRRRATADERAQSSRSPAPRG